MTPLLTFPGIVILVSHGRETMYMESGRPVANMSAYRVDGQRTLTQDVTAWLRMERDLGYDKARIVKLNSFDNAVKAPKEGIPTKQVRNVGRIENDFSLETFIFDTMGYDALAANSAGLPMIKAGSDAPLSDRALLFEQAIAEAPDLDTLRAVREGMLTAHTEKQITDDERRQLGKALYARKEVLEAQGVDQTRPDGNPDGAIIGTGTPPGDGTMPSDDLDHGQIRHVDEGDRPQGQGDHETEGEHQAARYTDVDRFADQGVNAMSGR